MGLKLPALATELSLRDFDLTATFSLSKLAV